MNDKMYTSGDIVKIFRMKQSRQALINAEKAELIPTANRVKRGKAEVRKWSEQQLAEIGEKYGFLERKNRPIVIAHFTPKGGVLKTSLTYSLGRTLALHNMNTLIIGLDSQQSITEVALNPLASDIESLDELINYRGLYDYYETGYREDITNFITSTQLPNLSVIPETPMLPVLQKRLQSEVRGEYVFLDHILPKLKEHFDVILFDCSPSWGTLVENALAASQTIISPIGCEPGSFQSLDANLELAFEYKRMAKIEWENFILVPTLKERNKLSSSILNAYLAKYADDERFKITLSNIRRSVQGAEAFSSGLTAFEYDPKSPLADDYYELFTEIWNQIEKG